MQSGDQHADFLEIRHDGEVSEIYEREGCLKAWNHFRRK